MTVPAETTGPPRPLSATTARLLLADAARVQRDGRLPSLVTGVVRDSALAWWAGRGTVDGVEPDDDLQYRLGSITKTVTAVAVLRLRDEGRLALDDLLERHVPGTPFGSRTVGQLLAHDAGVRAEAPTDWWERTAGLDWAQLSGRFTAADLPHPAGRRFHYSNLGFGLLGELVARLRGRPWAEVVQEEVLAPLGMRRTTPRPAGRSARGWAVHPWADLVTPEPEHDAGVLAAAGQLWSTLADLGRFAAFLLGDTGDVLAPATLAEMCEPAAVDAADPGWSAYGLGLQVLRVDGVTLVGHGGSMPGFLAGVLVDPDQATGAVVLANATSGLDGRLTARMLATVRAREPRVVAPWAPLAAPDDDAVRLVGTWYWGTTGHGLRLSADGLLHLAPLTGSGRPSRFRRRRGRTVAAGPVAAGPVAGGPVAGGPASGGPASDGWVGLDGYYAGEPLTPVLDDAGTVLALDLGSFVFTRLPYDPAAPVPGGTDPDGWRPGPT